MFDSTLYFKNTIMRKVILLFSMLLSFLAAFTQGTPNSLPGTGTGTGGGTGSGSNDVVALTAPSSTQVDTFTIELEDGTLVKLPKAKDVVVSSSAPSNPAVADMWIRNTDTSVWVNISSTWVELAIGTGSGGVTGVDDQVNGHDLSMNGSLVRSAPDISELSTTTAAGTDEIMVYKSGTGHRKITVSDIASLVSTSVTGVNDQNNGFDVSMNGSLVETAYDYDELPDDPTCNGTEVFIFKDALDGLYKKASTSWLSGLFMDLVTNQTAAGVKKFSVGLQYGSGTLPTGVNFGSANDTGFGLKGDGGFVSEANWANFGGLIIDNGLTGGIHTARIIGTGVDTPTPSASYVEVWTRPVGSSQDAVKNIRFASNGTTPIISVGSSTNAGGGIINLPVGGVGFDGASSNYKLSGVSPSAGFALYENGGINMEVPPGQQSWVPFSDIRMKHDTVRLQVEPADIRNFKSYEFKWNASDSLTIGVLAQQLDLLFPQVTHVIGGTVDTLGVDYNAVTAILFAAARTLQEQIDMLRPRVSSETGSVSVTASKSYILPVNSSGGAKTVNPPAGPHTVGDWFAVVDSRGTAGSNNITVNFSGAGEKFHSSTSNHTLSSNRSYARFIYIDSTVGWIKEN